MILTRVLKDLINQRRAPSAPVTKARGVPRVLNVGGGGKHIPIPPHYLGWEHLLLDIDARGQPDIVGDARKLTTFDPEQFDAIYCSHNLEHYYKHDGGKVLGGFLHLLKPDGFAEIRVPDLRSAMRQVVERGMNVEDKLYDSKLGPITVRDVIYGYGKQIEDSGEDFYAHKTGFVAASLEATLTEAGFQWVLVTERPEIFELHAFAFKGEPTPQGRALLGIRDPY